MSDYLYERAASLGDAQPDNPIVAMNEDDSGDAYNVPVDPMGNPIGVSASGGVAAGGANVGAAITAPITAAGNAIGSGISAVQNAVSSGLSSAASIAQWGAVGAVLIVGLMIWVELDRTKR
jgi:hypothetical protein